MNDQEAKILANAVYQIRLLLSGYLGSATEAPIDVRVAAHLAYALHNEAIALVEGRGFDKERALEKVKGIDGILGGHHGSELAKAISSTTA